MSKLYKFRKSTVAILTALLIISIAMPLLSLATAATSTVSLSTSSGPNGTAVQVTGSGFKANEITANIHVIVDGVTDSKVVRADAGATLVVAKQLAVDPNGVLSGYFIIGGPGALNLAPGPHTVQIYDSIANPPAVTFEIKSPTVTITPSTGPAGTSVEVKATGFPTSVTGVYTVTNSISAATFAGTGITVNPGTQTALALRLSSNSISATTGTYSGTVSLPGITSGSSFTLTDSLGNTGTTAFSLSTPTVTLSPASGPVGTVVTVTATGFGPGAAFSGASPVQFGSATTVIAGAALVPANAPVTEQGTSVFQFTVGSGTVDAAAGAHTVTITDSLKNAATATFTVTPTATLTVGDAFVSSSTTYVPTGVSSKIYLTATGFAPLTKLTITGTAGVPTNWLVFTATDITTDLNGEIATAVSSTTAANAPGAGQYQITVSDGVNPAQTITITVTASNTFYILSPNTGIKGTTVSINAYDAAGATAVTAATFDGVVLPVVAGATAIWPAAPTAANFTVPPSSAGQHIVEVTTPALGTVSFNTISVAAINTVSPASGAPGTTVSIAATGFAAIPVLTLDGTTIIPLSATASIITFALPNFIEGPHTIILTDASGNTAQSTVSIATPKATVSPNSGKLGTAITLTGSGFKAGEKIAITLDSGSTTGTVIGLTKFNPSGGIILYTGISMPATNLVAGAHTITVAGSTSGNAAVCTFTVEPTLTLTPTAVRPNSVVAVAGKGFGALQTVTLTLNGVQQAWFNTATTANTTTITTDINGNLPATAGVVVNASTAVGSLTIAATDALGYTASKALTVMSSPAITLNPTNVVAGSPAAVTIAGTGWSVTGAARTATVKLFNSEGTEVTSALALSGSPATVASDGKLPTGGSALTFTVASGIPAGVYTVELTLGVPTETATTTLTIMSAPSVVIAPTSANVGSNVSITILGLAPAISGSVYPITTALIGSTNIIGATWGTLNVPVTGANAYNLTTWFIVPANMTGGTYTFTVSDGTRSATTEMTIAGKITLTPNVGTTNIKGSQVNVAGTGFGTSGTAYTLTVNGVTLGTGTVGANGQIATNFIVPVTATATNTVVVTDAAGNTATSTLTVTAPTLTLIPSEAAPGQAVQIFGSGFNGASSIFVQIGNTFVTTNPTPLTASAGSFVAVFTVPAGLSGNQTITATDASNNVGTAYLMVTGGSGIGIPNQTTMTNTAKTTTPSGTATTTFTAGSSAQASFTLQGTSGSRDVVVAVTWQQGAKVYGMSSMQTTMDTTARTMSFQQLIPAGATGTWTATLQVFAADGTTPLGVTTLTFTVA